MLKLGLLELRENGENSMSWLMLLSTIPSESRFVPLPQKQTSVLWGAGGMGLNPYEDSCFQNPKYSREVGPHLASPPGSRALRVPSLGIPLAFCLVVRGCSNLCTVQTSGDW